MFATAIVACSGDSAEALLHQIDDAQSRIDMPREDVDAHASAASAAADLAALQRSAGSHPDLVRRHMDDLGHIITDMGECDGVPDDRVDSMMDGHDSCGAELERHRAASAGATAVDAARGEEQHHRTEMMDCLDELDDMMDTMMSDHGMAMCRGHHGMDDHERS